ncbi:MAG: hypothetical protein K2F85_05850, partial [Helicobacter sp.]|nr:hypothetical protein [Helicobacter sp.]
QWRIKDCNLQSGAVLWLRHSFARAFSGDSLLGDSLPVDCFEASASRNDKRQRRIKHSTRLIATLTFAMTQDYHCAKQAESGVIRVRNKAEQPLARNLRRRGLARGLLAQNNPA